MIWVFGAASPATTWSVDAFIRHPPVTLFGAVISGLFYLAIQPWVRRYWPEAMITWSRVLAGRWRDPVVARDVLVGIVWAMISTLAQRLVTAIVMWSGGPPTPPNNIFSPIGLGLEKLMGGWGIAADLPAHFLQISTAVQFFFGLFLFRLLLRRPWLGAGACFVFFMVLNGIGGVPIFGPAASLFVAMATFAHSLSRREVWRSGTVVLASMAMLTDGFLLTTNLGAWYGQSSVVAIVVVSVLALWAFRTSLGGRPLFDEHWTAGPDPLSCHPFGFQFRMSVTGATTVSSAGRLTRNSGHPRTRHIAACSRLERHSATRGRKSGPVCRRRLIPSNQTGSEPPSIVHRA